MVVHSEPIGAARFLPMSAVNKSALTFVIVCLMWYMSSAITNNIGKEILVEFRFPVTLTFVQL
jgi:hypothetical protein